MAGIVSHIIPRFYWAYEPTLASRYGAVGSSPIGLEEIYELVIHPPHRGGVGGLRPLSWEQRSTAWGGAPHERTT